MKQDFPIFKKRPKMVYLDSACTTLTPESVIASIDHFYRELSGCHGRSEHRLARMTTQAYEDARDVLSKFVGSPGRNSIVFCMNSTDAINRVALGLKFTSEDCVLTTDLEHNSNLLPWQRLAQKGVIRHIILPTALDGGFDMGLFRTVLREAKVKLVSTFWVSNVTGGEFPVHEIVAEAHKHNSLVLIDAAQAVLTHKIDVSDLKCDFLCLSGHKMFGPFGSGILYISERALENYEPGILGGNTVDDATYSSRTLAKMPEAFEAGIQNYASAVALSVAASYLNRLRQRSILLHALELNEVATDMLMRACGVVIVGKKEASHRGSILNFFVEGLDARTIARLLDEISEVMVRAGRHCAHPYYNARRIPDSVRMSFGPYNTRDEVEMACKTLLEILKHYR